MKTIAALDLRNDLEGVVKALKRGERMALTYRGELVGELAPIVKPAAIPGELPEANRRALEALKELHAITARDPDYRKKADAYLIELREDRIAYGDRHP